MSANQAEISSDRDGESTEESRSDPESGHGESSLQPHIRSSPHVLDETDEIVVNHNKLNMNKKRSHEGMNAEQDDAYPSSATIMGNVASSPVPAEEPSQANIKPSTAAHTSTQSMGPSPLPASSMGPPPLPASSTAAQFGSAPTSAQPHQKRKTTPPEAATVTQPGHEQPNKPPSPERKDLSESDDTTDETTEPQDQVEKFDWDRLMTRYHSTINGLNEQEDDVMNEFQKLCQVYLPLRVRADRTIADNFSVLLDMVRRWSESRGRPQLQAVSDPHTCCILLEADFLVDSRRNQHTCSTKRTSWKRDVSTVRGALSPFFSAMPMLTQDFLPRCPSRRCL